LAVASANNGPKAGMCNAGFADGQESVKEMAGFEYDQTSGMYYNTILGCYFDAKKQLYGDASSGQWYSFENGAYKLASLAVGSA